MTDVASAPSRANPLAWDGAKGSLARFALFQLVWAVAVLAAARGLAWPGAAACAAFAALHLACAPAPRAELRLLGLAVLLGALCETAFQALGVLRYAAPWPLDGLASFAAPAWILGLWAALASLLTTLLAWMRGRIAVAAALGAVGGCLSLRSGAALGALELGPPALWIPAVALEWAVLTPLLVQAGTRVPSAASPPTAG